MRRDDIEKAATQHANMIGWDHDPEETRGLFAYSFEKGAEWRINSAWYDASETPQHSGMLIAIKQDGTPIVCGPNNSNWKIAVRIFHIVRWAYIEDLLPITC